MVTAHLLKGNFQYSLPIGLLGVHRVSSSSRVWFEFETFELAHARSYFPLAVATAKLVCLLGLGLAHLVEKTGSV